MAGVRKPAKRKTKKTKARKAKSGKCRYVISVSGFGAGPKLHAATKSAALHRAKRASVNGETAVVERKCGRKSSYVASYEWGKTLD